MKPEPNITLSIEIESQIHSGIQEFLEYNSNWDQNRVIQAGISLFLSQNPQFIRSESYHACSQAYLHSICSYPN